MRNNPNLTTIQAVSSVFQGDIEGYSLRTHIPARIREAIKLEARDQLDWKLIIDEDGYTLIVRKVE